VIAGLCVALALLQTDSTPGDRLAARRERRGRFAAAAAYDMAGGGSRRRNWAGYAYAGTPWLGLRAQVGVGPRGLTIGVDAEAARLQRLRVGGFVALRWVDRPRVRLTGETALGYMTQGGVLARRGANAELRIRLAFPSGRVAPHVQLATAHTLLLDRTTVATADGETRDLSARHEWTPRATLGLAVVLSRTLGLDVGVDLFWYDAPRRVPALPGIHVGLSFGGGAR
jgi:hypothetical protein